MSEVRLSQPRPGSNFLPYEGPWTNNSCSINCPKFHHSFIWQWFHKFWHGDFLNEENWLSLLSFLSFMTHTLHSIDCCVFDFHFAPDVLSIPGTYSVVNHGVLRGGAPNSSLPGFGSPVPVWASRLTVLIYVYLVVHLWSNISSLTPASPCPSASLPSHRLQPSIPSIPLVSPVSFSLPSLFQRPLPRRPGSASSLLIHNTCHVSRIYWPEEATTNKE